MKKRFSKAARQTMLAAVTLALLLAPFVYFGVQKARTAALDSAFLWTIPRRTMWKPICLNTVSARTACRSPVRRTGNGTVFARHAVNWRDDLFPTLRLLALRTAALYLLLLFALYRFFFRE